MTGVGSVCVGITMSTVTLCAIKSTNIYHKVVNTEFHTGIKVIFLYNVCGTDRDFVVRSVIDVDQPMSNKKR